MVLLTAIGISATYYVLTRQDKQRESQQRIQIAFDIILDDFTNRLQMYAEKLRIFLEKDSTFGLTASSYLEDTEQVNSVSFLTSYLKDTVDTLKRFGQDSSTDRLALYGADKRLLAVYQKLGEEESVGAYMISGTGNDTYLPMDDFTQLSPILFGEEPIPDAPLPSEIASFCEVDIPDTISSNPLSEGEKFGIRIIAPIYHREEKVGALIADVFYTQELIERYASLSKTDITLFVEDQFIGGTLHPQPPASLEDPDRIILCEDISTKNSMVDIFPVTADEQDYYQGQCVFKDVRNTRGIITVSLSQDIEKRELRKLLTVVLTVTGVALGIAVVLLLILSRKPIRAIQNIVSIIRSVAKGDLRKTAIVINRDEVGMLAVTINQMVTQLREMAGQVQQSGIQVTSSATELSATAKQQEAMATNQLISTNNIVNAVKEISGVVSDLAQTMQQVASMSQETAEYANKGQTDLLRMEEAMRHMEHASQSISGALEVIHEKADNITTIVTTINKVSEQTNLLSLNAAIEAEKAGEYGRGFAVVAREIRRLADQTAVATLNIERMVQEMQSAITAGVMEMDKFIKEVQKSAEDVGKISMQLTLIIDQVQALSPNFETVNVAMKHQSENAQKINNAMMHLSEEMQQTKGSLSETYAVIEQLNKAAEGLQDEVSRFKIR